MTNSKILRDEFHRLNGTDPDNGLDIPKYLLWLEDRAVLPQANVMRSLPSDREIETKASEKYTDQLHEEAFRKGAKWMRALAG